MEKTDIKSLTLPELTAFVEELGEKGFRAKQIFQWLHQKNIQDFDEMTTVSKAFRAILKEKAALSPVKIAQKFQSALDNATKYLFALENHTIIESVFMDYDYGQSVCISSQAGCAMGCRFCASAIGGLERNLTAGEMASQIYMIGTDQGKRISHVVVMGCGEPLDNWDALLDFIAIINHKDGAHISQRHITVSTCGLVDKMDALAERELQITLAVSLHAPNDEIRRKLMPIANKYSMDNLLAACRRYADKTKRRITFEYALIDGVNDSKACAAELAKRIGHMLCHVNLIPVNQIQERDYRQSGRASVEVFAQILRQAGIETTVRRRLGNDINAACGQLRKSYGYTND